jgi:hypothetical protein
MNDKEKYLKMAELYTALANGKKLLFADDNGVTETTVPPVMFDPLASYSVKPDKRISDNDCYILERK